MEEYLRATGVVHWQHLKIIEFAKQSASGHKTSTAIAEARFEHKIA
jgi:hypothetical protein